MADVKPEQVLRELLAVIESRKGADPEGSYTARLLAAELVNAAGLELGRPFEEPVLDEAMERMRRLLEGNGYFEAAIKPDVQYEPATQQANITFFVAPGPRASFGCCRLNTKVASAPPAKHATR